MPDAQPDVMRRTIHNTPVVTAVLRSMCSLALKMSGWRLEGRAPDLPKYITVLAPHTSNWDWIVLIVMAFATRMTPLWLAKDSLFRWPFGCFFKWFGGIAVDRSAHHGVVGQIIDLYNRSDRLVIGITPEGTRKRVERWKTGFYRIAEGAGIPIVLAALDYQRKLGIWGPIFTPTGDVDADIAAMQQFFVGVTPRHPEKVGWLEDASGN